MEERRCSSRELVTLILSPSRKIPRPAEKQQVSWVVSQPCPCYGGVYALMQVASSASSSGQFELSQECRPQQSVVWGGHHGFSRPLEGKLEFEQSLVTIANLIKRRREWRERNLASSHFSPSPGPISSGIHSFEIRTAERYFILRVQRITS